MTAGVSTFSARAGNGFRTGTTPVGAMPDRPWSRLDAPEWMHDHDGMRIGASSAGAETYLVKNLRARLTDLEACDPDHAISATVQPARSAAA